MKKRVISFLMVLAVMTSLVGNAFAAQYAIAPRASKNLSEYSVSLSAKGGGEMCVAMSVDGMGVQEKIGIISVDIDQKVNGVWKYYDAQDAVNHPEFYDYNSRDYMGNAYFTGTPGVTYRVTLTVYARSASGSDTGYITSYAIVCK